MANEDYLLLSKIVLDTSGFNTGINNSVKQTKKLHTGVSDLKKLLGAFGITLSVYKGIKFLQSAIKEASEFQTAVADMRKVTQRSFDDLKKDIKDIDPILGDSTSLMKGYYQVISAGVTEPKQALELLTTASKTAKAAHMDQSEVIKGISKLMAGYGDEIKTTTEAADLLFTIEKVGQTSVAELIPVIGGLSAVSKELGVTHNEMGAALAQVTQFAGNTAEAATRYRSVLISLIKPSEAMTELFEEMGGTQEAIKKIGFSGVLEEIQKATGGSTKALGELFGSQEAVLGFVSLAKEGFAGFRDRLKETTEKAGALDTAFGTWETTFQATKETFDNTVKDLLKELGEELMPTVQKQMDTFSKWVKENKEDIQTFFSIIGKGVGLLSKTLTVITQFPKSPMLPSAEEQAAYLKSLGDQIKEVKHDFTGLANIPLTPLEIALDSIRVSLEEVGNSATKVITKAEKERKALTEKLLKLEEEFQIDQIKVQEQGWQQEVALLNYKYNEYLKDYVELGRDKNKLDIWYAAEYDKITTEMLSTEYTKILKNEQEAQRAEEKTLRMKRNAAEEKTRLERERFKTGMQNADNFFEYSKNRYHQDMGDWQTKQEKKVEIYEKAYNSMQNVNKAVSDAIVEYFTLGEEKKVSISEAANKAILSELSGYASEAISKMISTISHILTGFIAQAFGMALGSGFDVWDSLKNLGIMTAQAVSAMALAKPIAKQAFARGGWLSRHPKGGVINEGTTSRADDVYLGGKNGMNFYGSKGERVFVMNAVGEKMFGNLLEGINHLTAKGFADGGWMMDLMPGSGLRGEKDPVLRLANNLTFGAVKSAVMGWLKHGDWIQGIPNGIAEAIIFLTTGIGAGFAGKAGVDKMFKSSFANGGWLDVGFGLGGFINKIIPKEIRKVIPKEVRGVIPSVVAEDPVLGSKLAKWINKYRPPGTPSMIASDWLNLMADPNKARKDFESALIGFLRPAMIPIATDMLKPGVYHPTTSGAERALKEMKNMYIDSWGSDNRSMFYAGGGFIPRFKHGGVMPHSGLAYLEKNEPVLPAGTPVGNTVHIHINTILDSSNAKSYTRNYIAPELNSMLKDYGKPKMFGAR